MNKLKREEVYPWDNAVTELLYSIEGSEEYLKGARAFKELLSQKRFTNSAHQINDEVKISFLKENIITRVKKVNFSYSKVFYDITLDIPCPTEDFPDRVTVTRLYNVDSCFVTKP